MQNSTYDPASLNDFEKTKVTFNGQKSSAICPAGGTVNVDLTLTDDHLLTGCSLDLFDNAPGDAIKYQIVLPNGYVALQFIDWYARSFDKDLAYPAKLPAGLTLRIVYTSVGSQDVKIYANHILHKVLI